MVTSPTTSFASKKISRTGKHYGDPVVLKDNSRTRVTFVPFFIPHSEHWELAGKLVTWSKKSSTPRKVDEKSLSLSGEEVVKLMEALRSHLAIADEIEDNEDYLVVPMSNESWDKDRLKQSPREVAAAIIKILGQEEISQHLATTEISTELAETLRGAIRIRELQSAVKSLRRMLDSGIESELEYQRWCDEHYWALGPARQLKDNVKRITNSDQIDNLIIDLASGFADVVELKRPNMDVLRYDPTHKNYYFSSETSKAIGQCHRYLDVLHEVAANGLRDHPEIVAYHPRATIVIGRSHDWEEDKTQALHGLNQRLRSIKIITFDHLVAQSEAMLAVVSPKRSVQSEIGTSDGYFNTDDIPF